MNLDFLKDLGKQLADIWREIKVYQKFTVVLVGAFLTGMMIFLIANASYTRYTPLYPADRLNISDAAEIKAYMDGTHVPYKIQGDTLVMVPEEQVHRIRMDLAAIGIPKMNTSKGFELFDQNTWIKGEKELQVLEMRALKGQLEKDISGYENVKNASVILDIAPPRLFGGSAYQTKASVILNLMPGARLNTSQLRAITFHVSGAVRGLSTNMVAISDTTGKLYQAFDPEGDIDSVRNAEIAVEEHIKAKVDGLLAMVVGLDNFYSTVQVTMSREKMVQERKIFSGKVNGIDLGEPVAMSISDMGMQLSQRERAEMGTPGSNQEAVAGAIPGTGSDISNRDESKNQQVRQMAVPIDHIKVHTMPGRIDNLSIAVLIDKTISVDERADLPSSEMKEGKRDAQLLKNEIERQLTKILEGYQVKITPAVDFVEFDRTQFNKKIADESWSTLMEGLVQAGTAIFALAVVLGMFWTFNRFWKRHIEQPPSLEEEDHEEQFEFMQEPSLAEIEAMVESIKTRFQTDPTLVVDSMRDWLAEEREFKEPLSSKK
ncbi:MAG: Flagellar M-ring protein FliF [Chlamydiales bacterium]|jgi:flagellar M-ring protein FliF|nr:Flagellar M-ring protein FliF [Chlamydiales bacterium]